MDMGPYDSDTGASLESTKIVDITHLQSERDSAALVYTTAKRGRVVQLRAGCVHIHYFMDEAGGRKMIEEDEGRFGFKPGALLTAIFTNAPVN